MLWRIELRRGSPEGEEKRGCCGVAAAVGQRKTVLAADPIVDPIDTPAGPASIPRARPRGPFRSAIT